MGEYFYKKRRYRIPDIAYDASKNIYETGKFNALIIISEKMIIFNQTILDASPTNI